MSRDFVAESYSRHTEHFARYLADDTQRAHSESWLRTDTVDYWRHERMYRTLDPLLAHYAGASWLTVGDGRFGRDAHWLASRGAQTHATDISDHLLRAAKERSYIGDFSAQNAERLTFADEAFDFAFCKEAFHHFPRPMIALYEMLRVARVGVVFIEPNDEPRPATARECVWQIARQAARVLGWERALALLPRPPAPRFADGFEEINYIYSLAARDLDRAALGLGYAATAVQRLNDHYEAGLENEPLSEQSPLFHKVRDRIAAKDRQAAAGLRPWELMSGIIFKQPLPEPLRASLARAGFHVRILPRNPRAQ